MVRQTEQAMGAADRFYRTKRYSFVDQLANGSYTPASGIKASAIGRNFTGIHSSGVDLRPLSRARRSVKRIRHTVVVPIERQRVVAVFAFVAIGVVACCQVLVWCRPIDDSPADRQPQVLA